MSKFTSTLLASSALLMFSAVLLADTPPVLKISDGSNIVTIDDSGTVTFSGSCTPSTCSTTVVTAIGGQVAWQGRLGTFSTSFTVGISKPVTGPNPFEDLNIQHLTTTADGTITFQWTDTNFTTPGITGGTLQVGGILSGTGSSTYTAYFDSSNAEFGTGTPVGTIGPLSSGGPFQGTLTGPGPSATPFSMTEMATISLTAGSVLGVDFSFVALPSPLTLKCASNIGTVGVPYSSSLLAAGGVPSYTFSITSGSLPPGLTLNPTTGAITGTPTMAGTFTFTAQVTDSSGSSSNTTTSSCSINITSPPPISLFCPMSTGEVNVPYSSALTATGGVPSYTFSITLGSLPPGLTLNPTTGAITGTPTMAGTFTFTAQVADSTGLSAGTTTSNCTIVIAPPPSLTCSTIGTSGEVGVPFNSPAPMVTGGTTPYTFSVVGTLPPGLTLHSDGTITGTPTSAGSFSIKVTDANGISATGTCPYTIVGGPVLTCLSSGTSGEVGAPFNSPAPTVTGGTTPYTFSVVGTLPAGLTLNTSTGAITGTPTTSGTFSLQVQDSNGIVASGTCPYTIIPGPTLTCLTSGTTGEVGAPFSSPAPTVTGGTGPYTFSVVGTLPAGLTLDTSTGAITGTPTAAGSFSIKVTDAKGVSATGTCPYSVIGGPVLSCLSTGTTGEVGSPFSSPAPTVTGGTGPYTFSVVGTLPAGLTLNSDGSITGTPTAAGSFSIKVTDAKGVSATGTCPYSVIGGPVLTCLSTGTTGLVGSPFNTGALTVTGGTAPYTFSVVGTLPAGLTLNTSTGAITGTPTAGGTWSIKVTDSKGVSATGTCPYTITVPTTNVCALTWGYWKNHVSAWRLTSLVLGSQTYTQTELINLLGLPVAGDASINLAHQLIAAKLNVANGTNQATDGGAIAAADAILSTFSGKLPYNVDASSTIGTQMTTIAGQLDTFNSDGLAQPGCSNGPAPLTATCASSTGQVNVAYSSKITVSGGLAPYTFSIVGGSLPPGLTLNTSTGAITGTPTTAGTFNFSVLVSDSTAAPGSTTGEITTNCSITISPASQSLTITCPSSSATVNASYSSSTKASGGTGPYTYSVASGALPTGLTLNTSTGAITGTPTKSGTYLFTIKAVDYKGNSVTSTGCSITVGGGIAAGQFITYTQGGWGAPPKGNNPGALLTKYFTSVYTSGSVSIGGTKSLTFNSALAITNFLPQGGTPGALSASALNAMTSAAGVFAGQVLALQLSVDFSNKGITPTGLANLHVVSGPAAGLTVAQVLALANSVLGGAAPPSGYSISDINNVIDAINSNFDGGTTNNGYLQQ